MEPELSRAGWSEYGLGTPEPVTHAPSAGTEATRYRKERLLGRGGMGAVHSAHDDRLDRYVALKETAREDPGLAERLEREAKILAHLDHPGIVPLFDAGTLPSGRPYYTMPRLEGRTLSQALADCGADGEPPAEVAQQRLGFLRAVLTVCEAVAHAHDRGIVHRDIKPSNVMLGARGETLVLDWGLARRHSDDTIVDEMPEALDGRAAQDTPTPRPAAGAGEASATGGSSDDNLTRRGAVVGTPRYMAPEQLRGVGADRRSDVWSLGALLHEVLVGEPPPAGASDKRRASDKLRARAWRRSPYAIPTEVAAIAARAMEADPEARYPNAGAMAADLARFIDGRWVDAYDYSSWEVLRTFVRRHRTPLMLIAAALLGVTALGGWAWWRTETERDRAVEAEQVALDALETSRAAEDRTQAALHDSRVGQAQLAARVGTRAEAELLALDALTLGESPVARGVLAAYQLDARPQLQTAPALSLRDCATVDLDIEGRYVGCSTRDAAFLYDARSGELIKRFEADGRIIDGITIPPADPPVVAVLQPERARFFGLEDLEFRLSLAGSGSMATYDGPGGTVLVGHGKGLRRYDPSADRIAPVPVCSHDREPWVERVAADDDSQRLVALCSEAELEHVGPDGKPQAVYPYDHLACSALLMLPGADHYWVGSSGGVVVAVDFETGAEIRRIETGRGRVTGLVPSPDGTMLAVLGERRGISIVHLESGEEMFQLPTRRARDVAFVGRDQLLVASESLELWNLPSHRQPRRFMADAGLSSAALSHDGRWVAATDGAGWVWVWERSTGEVLFHERFQRRPAKDVAFSPDDAVLASTAMSEGVIRIDTARWRAHLDPLTKSPARRVDFVGDDVVFLPYGSEPRIERGGGVRPEALHWWRHQRDANWADGNVSLDHGTYVALRKDTSEVFRYSSAEIAAATKDGSWPDGTSMGIYEGAFAVDVTDDGEHTLVARRTDVRLLDPEGQPLVEIEVPDHRLTAAAVDPRGRYVVAGTLAGRVLVWSADRGELLAVMQGHDQRVISLRFDPTSAALASASWDQTVALWDLNALDADPEATLAEATAAWGLEVEDVMPALLE